MRIFVLVVCVFLSSIVDAKDKCRFANKKLKKVEKYIVDGENIFMADGGKLDVKFFSGKCAYSNHTYSEL